MVKIHTNCLTSFMDEPLCNHAFKCIRNRSKVRQFKMIPFNPFLFCTFCIQLLLVHLTSFFKIKYWSKNTTLKLSVFQEKNEFPFSSKFSTTTTSATTTVWCVDKMMKRGNKRGSVRISATSFYPFASLAFSIIRIQTNQEWIELT